MKTLIVAAVAALGVGLGLAPQQASAGWEVRTTSRWDRHCGRYVTYQQRYWVPDCHDHYHGPSYLYRRDRYDHGPYAAPYEPSYYPGRYAYPDRFPYLR